MMNYAVRIGLFCLFCFWIVFVGFHLGGIIDDAYIFCRYADNLVNSHGLVFNKGEKVEGITSFGHTILVSAFLYLGMDGRLAAITSSFLAGIGVVFILLFFKSSASKIDYLRAAIMCCSIPFLIWSSSGMDECLLMFGVVLLFKSAEQSRIQNKPFSTKDWFIAGFTFIFRPEGLLIYLSMFLVSIKDLRDNPKTTIKGLLIGAIPIFLLTIFRFLYFGSMLPNTFHAKAGGISMALFIRGFQYGISAMIGFLPLFLLGTWGMIRKPKEKYSQLAMVMSLLFLLGLVVVGGDTFPLYRFALPIIPILSIFAAPQLLQIKSDSKIRHLIVTVFLLILLGWTINPMNPFSKISEMDQFLLARKQAATWELVGKELPKQFGIHHSLALTPIGAIGYRSHWPIIDLVGLIDKHIAHMSVPLGKGMAGHEKFDANYVLSKNPDFILLHTWLWSKIPPKEALESSLGMQAEQNMYRNPVFIRNYQPIIIPIFGRYLIIFERKNLLLNSRPG